MKLFQIKYQSDYYPSGFHYSGVCKTIKASLIRFIMLLFLTFTK